MKKICNGTKSYDCYAGNEKCTMYNRTEMYLWLKKRIAKEPYAHVFANIKTEEYIYNACIGVLTTVNGRLHYTSREL